MWALDHPEFKLHPMFRSMATPIQPGPWNRVLYTSGEYEGYLPSDNPKYGGNGTMSYDWDYPSRSVTYKTTKYPPEDWHNKEQKCTSLDILRHRHPRLAHGIRDQSAISQISIQLSATHKFHSTARPFPDILHLPDIIIERYRVGLCDG